MKKMYETTEKVRQMEIERKRVIKGSLRHLPEKERTELLNVSSEMARLSTLCFLITCF